VILSHTDYNNYNLLGSLLTFSMGAVLLQWLPARFNVQDKPLDLSVWRFLSIAHLAGWTHTFQKKSIPLALNLVFAVQHIVCLVVHIYCFHDWWLWKSISWLQISAA
jgi:hypothetical protein